MIFFVIEWEIIFDSLMVPEESPFVYLIQFPVKGLKDGKERRFANSILKLNYF